LVILILPVLYSTRNAFSLETLTLALPAKSFRQQIIYPLAQERGYMKEEGIYPKLLLWNRRRPFRRWFPDFGFVLDADRQLNKMGRKP
jgi:hypothetical protein